MTDKRARSLPAPPAGNRIFYDGSVPGFGLRVTAGGARSFVLNYRIHGAERRYTIGGFPTWKVAAARAEAKELRKHIDRGDDPLAERQRRRNADTVSELLDQYIAEHVETHNKESTRREFKRLVEAVIKPRLGRLKVELVTTTDIERFHRALKDTPRSANQALAVLSKAFNLAEKWGVRPKYSNPVKHVERFRENRRDRYLSLNELKQFDDALTALQNEKKIEPVIAALFRFLVFTGMRIGEALALEWKHIDAQTGVIHLADAKAGARSVSLGASARLALAELPQDHAPVFARKDGRPIDYHAARYAWLEICKRAKLTGVRPHDLRHTFGTYAGTAGLNAFMVRDLLGHKTLAMANRYVGKRVEPIQAAADAISGQIAAAMAGKTAKVTPFKRKSRHAH